ncbi:hypothetical protein HHI36_009240 [Cryptolaemus montrouzieri]|uniref:HTH psq-type domain-containing protein n=1 Tax=Cryptolaemus montrouzieri TaxID=559131 RepID=A0ABD2MUM2_9CUCU
MEKTKRKGKWDQSNLQTAIDKILSKEMSLREASLRYKIPKSTIHDKTSSLNRGQKVVLQPKLGRFTNTFTPEYEQLLVEHIRANAESRITDYDIAGPVNEAFTEVARLEIAVSGFKCTGIQPFDRDIFSDLDYLPADMINIPLEDPQTSSNAVGTSKEVSCSDLTEAGSSSTKCDLEHSNNMDTQGSSEASKKSICQKNINSPKPLPNLDPDVVQVIHNLSPLPDDAKKRSLARKRKCE